jgi:hypothetical protein
MVLNDFYAVLDTELVQIASQMDKNKHDPKRQAQHKSYAQLLWFLRFYGQKYWGEDFITDGTGDMSCDIIFSNKNADGKDIFYVVQSKWVSWDSSKSEKEYPQIKKEEFNQTITDFTTLLTGKSNSKNAKFNTQLEKLLQHLKERNGVVKFIFFSLAQYNPEIELAYRAFNNNFSPNVSFEVIDIHRIREDFISYHYKQIQSNNPLEYHYEAEYGEIELEIERTNGNGKSSGTKRDFLEYDGRAKAYIFLLQPKVVWSLFRKYKYGLFFKNVRNPIRESDFNKKIEETLLKRPNAFWYFNNGITAISKFIPEVGVHAKKIKLTGLQVINGAQTVYYIYRAYEQASPAQRKVMDADARIALRLIRSSDEEFNLQITRYTNSQNPMSNRDFMANDDVQQRLQNESFKTNVWYEKRVGEFVESNNQKSEKITLISNEIAAIAYLAFHLQRPIEAINMQDHIFISRKESVNGLYEDIFNEESKYEDVLASINMYSIIYLCYTRNDNYNLNTSLISSVASEITSKLFPIFLAISKIILEKYLIMKYGIKDNHINASIFINKSLYEGDIEKKRTLYKVSIYSMNKIYREKIVGKDFDNVYKNLISSSLFYQNIVEEIKENQVFTIREIDEIEISENLKIKADL